MDAADGFARHKQVFYATLTVHGDFNAAVLIVQRGIDEDRRFAHIDAELQIHAQHGGQALFQRALAVDHIDHGRIEPYGAAGGRGHALAVGGAFADHRRGVYIAGFQRMYVNLAFAVDQLCAHGTHLFGDQRAVNLRRKRNAGGMILKRILIEQLRARAIRQHEAVRRRAVMVAGREALIVHTSRAAGCQNHALGARDAHFAGFHIQKHRACHMPLIILDQFDGGGEIHHRNAAVQHFIAQGTHDFRAGIVRRRVHALAGGAAAVGGDHGAVLGLIKFHAQFIEPFDRAGRIVYQLLHQFGAIAEVAAAHYVQIVLRGGIAGLIRRLNAALRHHGVGVANAQLGHDHHVRARFIGFDRRGGARAAAADDQHIHIVIDLIQIDMHIQNAASAFQHFVQLDGRFFALVAAHADGGKAVVLIIGMIRFQKRILFFRRHAARLQRDVRFAGSLNLFHGCEHFLSKYHCVCPPYFSISRWL